MSVIEIAKIVIRKGQELQTGIPQLDAGEFGWAEDTEHLYIGKRIAEGAPDDNNTRILTENDLNFFQLLAQTTGTNNAHYRYREDISSNLIHTTTSTIQTKLDAQVSLTDFGVSSSPFLTPDITTALQGAINDLFANQTVTWYSGEQKDFRRTLLIPAGTFIVSNTITLPPHTTIVGAGEEMTIIRYANTLTSMFQTVDAVGNAFQNTMQSGAARAKDVVIQGMTLEFSNILNGAKSLISLDNVLNAHVENCTLRTQISSTLTETYGLINWGTGIEIRGQGGSGVELCQNVHINNCKFDGLLTAIKSTGTVVRPVIENSIFSNLNQGIVMNAVGTLQGPSNAFILENRFQDILHEAIYVGVNPNNLRSNHLSANNHFTRVGNGVLNEFTTTAVSAVISYYSPGNKTTDDFFNRRAYANLSTSADYYYNPLINGSTTISDKSTYTATIATNTTANIAKISLNNSDQMATMNYQLYNSGLSRKGTLLINIAPDASVSMTDNYNYSESLVNVLSNITTATGSTVNTLVVNAGAFPIFGTVTPLDGTWYLTGSSVYAGKSAFITGVVSTSGNYIITTDSAEPTFNYGIAAGETYALLKSESPNLSFYYTTNTAKNYITITCTNGSVLTNSTLDYQLDIQT